MVGVPADLLVPLRRYGDYLSIPRPNLLDVADHLVISRALGRDGHHRNGWVQHGDGAVLQLAGRVALGVDVADFLELQRTLQSCRIPESAPEEEEGATIAVRPGQLGRLIVEGQKRFYLARQPANIPDDRTDFGVAQRIANLSQVQCQ